MRKITQNGQVRVKTYLQELNVAAAEVSTDTATDAINSASSTNQAGTLAIVNAALSTNASDSAL